MSLISIRHFAEEDIPARSELLREERFQANLTDFATLTEDDALAAGQRATIEGEHDVKRIFTVVGRKGQVMGFCWITSIDWCARVCELSFGMLPNYRRGWGGAMAAAALEYLYDELNMAVVVNQVLAHNTMLQSASRLAQMRRVVCDHDSYTVGEWRTALYWTQSREEFFAGRVEDQTRRVERSRRIRAAVAAGAS